jgi:hypothetical protein
VLAAEPVSPVLSLPVSTAPVVPPVEVSAVGSTAVVPLGSADVSLTLTAPVVGPSVGEPPVVSPSVVTGGIVVGALGPDPNPVGLSFSPPEHPTAATSAHPIQRPFMPAS